MPANDNTAQLSTASVFGRELPFSQEAEEAVLGSILLDPECLSSVAELLKPESFYRPQHQQLFNIILRTMLTQSDKDIISVIDESVTMGVFESSAMAKTYLTGLMENVPSTANIESYCKIIDEKAKIRSLIVTANDILQRAYYGSESSADQLDSAEQAIFDIRQGKNVQGFTRIGEVIVDTFSHLEELSGPDAEEFLGATSGFKQLDSVITGLNKTDLIIIAARPGMGKSAFALNIAVNMCKATKKETAIFSLEMGKEQLVSRMLASEALVDNTLFRTGKLQPEDWDKIALGAETLSRLPILIDDGAGTTVAQMKAKLRRLKNLGLVVIDYIQLMQSPNKNASRVEVVSEITRQLKLMAKELNVPVIALSQLSRSSEKREDKHPVLSDLRESGSIEQDADIILFLYRDNYYDKEADNKSVAECIVAKNRHGELKTVQLGWIGEYTLFRSLDFRRDNE